MIAQYSGTSQLHGVRHLEHGLEVEFRIVVIPRTPFAESILLGHSRCRVARAFSENSAMAFETGI